MENSISRRNWLEVNLDNLSHNYAYLNSLSQNSFLPILKANAYANGSKEVFLHLIKNQNASRFALADVAEAVQLRKLTEQKIELISLSPVINLENTELIDQYKIIPVISSLDALENLVDTLKIIKTNSTIPIWLKINTGMNRLGIKPKIAKKIIESIESDYSDLIEIKMIMTHLSSAEEKPEFFSDYQIRQFNSLMQSLNQKYPTSIGNSAFLLNPEITQYDDLTRSGLALYGISPFYQENISDELQAICQKLKPTASLKARVIALDTIKALEYVGYSRAFQASKKTNIATVSIGYADGYPRHIPTGTQVMINGQIAHIIGRISMDSLSIDINQIPVSLGDIVTFWGDGLDVNEIASAAETIAYEILSRTNPRGGKIYLNS